MDDQTRHFRQKAKEYREQLRRLKKGRRTAKKVLLIEKTKVDLNFARWVLKRNRAAKREEQ